MKVYIFNNEDKTKLDVGFDSSINMGGNFEQYKHFKYTPPAEYATNRGKVKLHKLSFTDLTPERIETIKSILQLYIEPMDERTTSIIDVIESFSDYFSKRDDDFVLQKLIGDIGEVVFILKLQEKGIDYRKYYQLTEQSLCDFNFNGQYVDVKTTSSFRKSIIISKRQLDKASGIAFFVCEINKLEHKSNIINLLESVQQKNEIILNKLHYWNEKIKSNDLLINSWTVDMSNTDTYFIDRDIIPQINILQYGGLIDMQLKVSVASAKKKPIDEIKKFI